MCRKSNAVKYSGNQAGFLEDVVWGQGGETENLGEWCQDWGVLGGGGVSGEGRIRAAQSDVGFIG